MSCYLILFYLFNQELETDKVYPFGDRDNENIEMVNHAISCLPPMGKKGHARW
jgi:hypothetical protein